jgi:hypothetical protein
MYGGAGRLPVSKTPKRTSMRRKEESRSRKAACDLRSKFRKRQRMPFLLSMGSTSSLGLAEPGTWIYKLLFSVYHFLISIIITLLLQNTKRSWV